MPGSSASDTNIPVSHGGEPCPDLSVIEEIAGGREATEAEHAHLRSCPECSNSVRRFAANLQLLTRLQAVMRPENRPRAGKRAVTPDLIPGYCIIEEIERGAQGVVYKAIQERTKRVVAVKMLLGGTLATEKQRTRFEREVEIVASLNHPGIVTIYDSAPALAGRYAYAMEYVEGGLPLNRWAARLSGTARENIRAKLAMIAAICDAVHYAHQRGVMHRDLKPANILVDGAGHPRVLDFGIARAAGSEVRATLTMEFAGTLGYASPEQLDGRAQEVDVRTDVYSLGAVLFELLGGRLPHPVDEKSVSEAVRMVTQDPPTRLRSIDRSFGEDLETITTKALERDVARRYQSSAALAADIRNHLDERPLEARRDSTWYVIRKALRRRRGVVGTILAALLLLLGSGAAIGYSMILARLASAREMSERERAAAETVRVGAISAVLREVLPPARVALHSKEAENIDRNMLRLQGKIRMGSFAREPAKEAAAEAMLGLAFRDRGALMRAEEAVRLSLHRAVAVFGDEHTAVAQALHELASVLLDRHRFPEASVMCTRAIRMRTKLLGADHPQSVESRDLHARILLSMEQTSEALAEAEAATRSAERMGEGEQLLLGACLDTWSAALLAAGRSDEAERACRRALSIRLDNLGDDDPFLCASLHRLADILDAAPAASASNDLALAVGVTDRGALAARLRQIADILGERQQAQWLGPKKSATATALEQLLALKRSIFGPRSRAVGQTLAIIGWRLADEGKDSAAEDAFREAIAILEEHRGSHDLTLANCLEHLAMSLTGERRFAEAVEVAGRQLAILRLQPAAHLEGLNVALCQRDMGQNMIWAGQYAEAVSNLRASIDDFRELGGPNLHSLGVAMTMCGVALLHTNQPEEAEAMARQGREIALNYPALSPDQRMEVNANLGVILAERGAIDEADPLLMEAWKQWSPELRSLVPPNDPYCLLIAEALRRINVRRGNEQEAARWAEELKTPPQRKP